MSVVRETVLGVDPGLSGALAFLNLVNGEVSTIKVYDIPTFEVRTSNRKTRQELNAAQVAAIVRDHRPSRAFVELVGAMPGQGVVSMFRFGYAAGAIHGCLAALQVPTHPITPQEWGKTVRLPKGDGASRMVASRLFPNHASDFARVKDHGRADAVLIAWAGHLRG